MIKQDERFIEGRSGKRSTGKGSIVHLTSIVAHIPIPGCVQYVSSKAAGLAVARCAALELCRQGVRVNTLSPAWVDTPLMERVDARLSAAALEARAKLLPLGRMATVEEVAGVVHFLSGPDASYITGVDIIIDAGAALTTTR